MQLICLSASHHDTPLELRECFSLPDQQVDHAFKRFPLRAGPFEPILEMAVLSTCNRFEVYAVLSFHGSTMMAEESPGEAFQPLLHYIEEAFQVQPDLLEPYVRRYSGLQVVEHLHRVAAGLDSIALGETQILGQVSRSLETALQRGSARHVLPSLFRAAIHTGKRVRAETPIGKHPPSLSALAVQLAEKTLGKLTNRCVFMIGAGKMGEAALEALHASGVQQILLTNRTASRAEETARRYGGRVLPYESLVDGLVSSDMVIACTASPTPILSRDLITEVMALREQRPLTLIDLAVPRNVEKQTREIPNVRVFDMDDLQTFALDTAQTSFPEVVQAEAIVREEVAVYEKLLRIIPFVGELHKKVEEIRRREVEKTLRHLDHPDAKLREQVEMLSRSLVSKILHEPTMHLRTETNQETLNDYVDTLARLFDLAENNDEYLSEDSLLL